MSRLIVQIIQGKGMTGSEILGRSDAFVEVRIKGEVRCEKTTGVHSYLNDQIH